MPYSYNYEEGLYWIQREPATEQILHKPVESSSKAPLSYYSDTGQLISNCFFFIEGIDSETVQNKIRVVIDSKNNLSSHPDIVNLANEDLIASFVFKYVIQNNFCDYFFMDSCLSYLASTSLYFSEKIGGSSRQQGVQKRAYETEAPISRCSYKFCIQTYCCQYNYPEGKKKGKPSKGCYSDHYPHYKVYQDIISLQSYIRRIHETNNNYMITIRSNQEIIKCINTIAYVIKHMYDELWNIYVSCKKDPIYERNHQNLG